MICRQLKKCEIKENSISLVLDKLDSVYQIILADSSTIVQLKTRVPVSSEIVHEESISLFQEELTFPFQNEMYFNFCVLGEQSRLMRRKENSECRQ